MAENGAKSVAAVSTDERSLRSHFLRIADVLFGAVSDVAEYKQVALGMIFLKYISDAFESSDARLLGEQDHPGVRHAPVIFSIPPEARWAHLAAQARVPDSIQRMDNAMAAIEQANPALSGVIPRESILRALRQSPPGKLIRLINDIESNDEPRSGGTGARVYEIFLSLFAQLEGRRAIDFHTPRCVSRLLIEMIAPHAGVVYDPCCGTANMLVQAVDFAETPAVRAQNTRDTDSRMLCFGQNSNRELWQLATMFLAIRGIEARIAHSNTLYLDHDPGLEADFILTCPPFNASNWGRASLKEDARWKFGVPPERNANFAWMQHVIHHLAPGGVAGVVLSNNSMTSRQSSEKNIRRALIEAGLVVCVVALPGCLFTSTPISTCLWILAKGRANGKSRRRDGELLFIDASRSGQMVNRTHRQLTDADIERITRAYHAWRGQGQAGAYEDVTGFCKNTSLREIRDQEHLLAPDLYVPSNHGG